MNWTSAVASITALIGLISCHSNGTTEPTSSVRDEDIVKIDKSTFDKSAMAGKKIGTGMQHGVAIVADYRCGDVCPDNTIRIIHYDVEPGPKCSAVNGLVESVNTGLIEEEFCVPRTVANPEAVWVNDPSPHRPAAH